MFVDAVHRKYIEECGAANFFGIKDNTYITPKSTSILPSITNKSLRQLAKDMGMKVEERPVAVDELSTFEECAACGTGCGDLAYRLYLRQGNGSRMEVR